MKKAKKVVALALCAVMLVVGSVAGTMAYLTSQDAVTNTFTVGKVAITLDEADVKLDGTYESDKNARVDENTYKLMPGHTYIKDPVIRVASDSEESWLFVEVTNEIANIEATGDTTVAAQMNALGWTKLNDTNVYYYDRTVVANDNIPVFTTFTINGDVKDLADYAGKKIIVTAYAIQADGFSSATEAWTDASKELTR